MVSVEVGSDADALLISCASRPHRSNLVRRTPTLLEGLTTRPTIRCRIFKGMIFAEPCRRLPHCFFKHSREVVAIGKSGFFGNFINAFFGGLQKSGGFPDSHIDQIARGTRAKVFLEKAVSPVSLNPAISAIWRIFNSD